MEPHTNQILSRRHSSVQTRRSSNRDATIDWRPFVYTARRPLRQEKPTASDSGSKWPAFSALDGYEWCGVVADRTGKASYWTRSCPVRRCRCSRTSATTVSLHCSNCRCDSITDFSCLAFDGFAFDVKGLHKRYWQRLGKSDDDVVLHVEKWSDHTYTDEHYHVENWPMETCCEIEGKQCRMVAPSSGSLSVTIRQSLNVPPALWAADQRTGIAKKSMGSNPQLARMQLGDESIIRWKDSSGLFMDSGAGKAAGVCQPANAIPWLSKRTG